MCVGVADDHRPRLGRDPGVALGEIAPVRIAVYLEHGPGVGRALRDPLDVNAVGLAAQEQAPSEVAEQSKSGCSIATSTLSVIAALPIENEVWTLPITQSSSARSSSG